MDCDIVIKSESGAEMVELDWDFWRAGGIYLDRSICPGSRTTVCWDYPSDNEHRLGDGVACGIVVRPREIR